MKAPLGLARVIDQVTKILKPKQILLEGPLWSCMVACGTVWSPMVLYSPVWSVMGPMDMVIYDHLWLLFWNPYGNTLWNLLQIMHQFPSIGPLSCFDKKWKLFENMSQQFAQLFEF